MINLDENDIKIIEKILRENLNNCEIRVFGSRINGKAKKYSDLDLIIIASEKVEAKKLYKLMEEFEYSKLNIRVDIIDYNSVSDSFKKVIDQQNELLLELN